MAEYAVQSAAASGSAVITYVAATGSGDLAQAGARRELRVKCGATGTTVTVVGAQACNLGLAHDLAVVVAANTEVVIPLRPERFGRAADGKAVVNYTSVVTVTVALVET